MFFSFWLTSLCIRGSKFIYVTTMTQIHSFLCWVIFCCINLPQYFIHSFVYGHLGCIHVWGFLNIAVMNIQVHVSFRTVVFSGYLPSSVVARSFHKFILSFLRNVHTVPFSGYISLHSHQQCKRVPFLHSLVSIYCL